MGANMARRLKDESFQVTAVYDAHPEHAKALSEELGCAAPSSLNSSVLAAPGQRITGRRPDLSGNGYLAAVVHT